MLHFVAVTAHALVRRPGPPIVKLTEPDRHMVSWGSDASVSMDTASLQETYLAIRQHLSQYGVLPTSLEIEADEARRSVG